MNPNSASIIFKSVIITFFLLTGADAFTQSKHVIVKFKKNTPGSVLENFKRSSPDAGNSSISTLCRSMNIKNSSGIFEKSSKHFTGNSEFKSSGLDRIFIISIEESKLSRLISLAGKNEYIEYIQPNNSLKLENSEDAAFNPNDPLYASQSYLSHIGINNAWDITTGDSSVIIGVIDTGLDFLHPDLQTSFKINYGEYGNGKESNGIDDDNNGFIDDYRGWDFTDEPLTGDPRRGDYLTPDNDPSDDNKNSHGTAVTGIINASMNNNAGIASVAPGCKVLVMRAFDAEGYGEEDDVANAILYGISNGVRVLNCSFGDYVFSNLLRDVIKFAYSQNVTIICSAGNDGRDRLHYPSAYDEVISVGASDLNDAKTSFSSYGETVDIFAPGLQNLTTMRVGKGSSQYNNDYDKINGTSFAAPIVSGVAAMLLSLNPALTNEEVRGILVSSTTLMQNQNSWNHLNASGRINALNALQNFQNPSIVRIHSPFQDYSFDKNIINFVISAASPLFLSYSLFYGIGEKPSEWIPLIQNRTSQALEDSSYNWNASGLEDTSVTLRLAINSNSGRTIEHRMIIFKDQNPPEITDVAFGNLIDKNSYSQLILFATNKRTLGKIYYKRKSVSEPYQYILADLGTPNIGFVADAHFGLLSGNELTANQEYEFYIEAVSLNGKTAVLNDTAFHFYIQNPINTYGYNAKNYSLSYSQFSKTVFDVNGNGKNDLLINDIKNNLKLNIYEFSNGEFIKISNDNWSDFKIARDISDVNGNGKSDMLLSKERNGFLYEASAVNSMPDQLIWSDSTEGNFWSGRIADTDNDGKKEILGFGISGLRILENSGGNNFNEISLLHYYGYDSTANSQNILVDDFNSDGKKEIVFSNLYYETPSSPLPKIALSVYTNISDNNFQRIYLDTIDRFIKGDNIVSGDFNGDGKQDFALGVVSKDGDLIQYYSLYAYTFTVGNTVELLDVTDIYNYKSYTETSTLSADIDSDGKSEVLVNTGTLFYVLKYSTSDRRFIPDYFKQGINSFNQLAFDFDGNGTKEIGLNTVDDTLLFFEKNTAFTGPSTPLNIKAYSTDSNEIKITFEPVAGADIYRIYKSDTTINFALTDSVNGNTFSDMNVVNRKNYYYKISAVDNENPVRESILSDIQSAYCHNKSKLISAVFENDGFLTLRFSERLPSTIPNLNLFTVNNKDASLKNAAIKNNFEYLLSFENKFVSGSYSVKTNGLTDYYNSPVDTNSAVFTVTAADSGKFYISRLSLSDKFRLKVEFNLEADSVTVLNTGNYKFEPFGLSITKVSLDNADHKIIYLDLENRSVIGATGKNYLLKAENIYSSDGIKIVTGAGSSFGLIFNSENLDNMYVYPNPYSINSNQDYITFANITRDAEIDIFDLTGKYLVTIKETNGNGGVEWDLKDENGNKVNTGIYIYKANGKNSSGTNVDEKTGKFAVIK